MAAWRPSGSWIRCKEIRDDRSLATSSNYGGVVSCYGEDPTRRRPHRAWIWRGDN
ncbi:hypothetical protein BDA96_01G181100 [Sorghum bicolor]|uniref:Uncharacterized protein n=1 Tax=Sorghum bicolor TaxID=4558 RepID=A0A921RY00_SORBI|nr:hypothetical protein BDA96_01G181100 [Sorghum bicolor]